MAASDPTEGRPPLSVVVATRDRPASLAATLAALHGAVGAADEVVVVDSASADGATRAVAAQHGARYLRVEQPGASRARNVGLRGAWTPVVAFTDDDCRPRPGWADAFATAFADASVGFAVGPVHGVAGGSAADVDDRGVRRWTWPSDPAHIGSGASLAVRRTAALDVDGFDERLGPGAVLPAGEDHELLLRLLHAGWAGAFCTAAAVDHDDRRGRWATLRLFYRYGVGAGAVAATARSLDPALARRMLGTRLWEDGARRVAGDLARRWEEPAARGAAMTVGVLVGAVRGGRLRARR